VTIHVTPIPSTIEFSDAAPTTVTVVAQTPAAGSAVLAQRGDHLHGSEGFESGFVFVGSETTAAQCSSTSPVDLLSITSIAITAATPFMVQVSARMVSGTNPAGGLGLKLNATVVGEARNGTSGTSTAHSVWGTSSAGAIGLQGTGIVQIPPRVTNYLRAGTGYYMTSTSAGAVNLGGANTPLFTNDMPTAEITAVHIRAVVDSSGNSHVLEADEFFLHSYAIA